ncbi:hypothetical protein [Aliarcobacter butzleri]
MSPSSNGEILSPAAVIVPVPPSLSVLIYPTAAVNPSISVFNST